MQLFVITNHGITDEQRKDAIASLGVSGFVKLPDIWKEVWGRIPPEAASVDGVVQPVLDWLSEMREPDDIVWVQGEWGATVTVLDYCRRMGIRCVYSTTARVAEDINTPEGVKATHIIKHVRYRDYPKDLTSKTQSGFLH